MTFYVRPDTGEFLVLDDGDFMSDCCCGRGEITSCNSWCSPPLFYWYFVTFASLTDDGDDNWSIFNGTWWLPWSTGCNWVIDNMQDVVAWNGVEGDVVTFTMFWNPTITPPAVGRWLASLQVSNAARPGTIIIQWESTNTQLGCDPEDPYSLLSDGTGVNGSATVDIS